MDRMDLTIKRRVTGYDGLSD